MRLHQRISEILCSLVAFATSLTIGYGTWMAEDKIEKTSSNIPTNTNVRAVCYNGSTSTKYATIEKALSEATSGDEVFVIPGLKNADGTIYEIDIATNCVVKEGVTLSLPYKDETCYDDSEHGTAGFADATTDKVNSNRQTLISIKHGYTLTVKGTLNIGGVLGSPNVGLSGQTSGSYCEINLETSASLVCDAGKINCYGFIKRASKNVNASLTVTNGGILMTPFIIYDFKGGNITTKICSLSDDKKYCPFQVFDLCNIQVKTTIEAGSYWKACASLYISTLKYYVSAAVNFISSEMSNTALILKEGAVALDYTSDSAEITIANSHKTTIEINGKTQLGNLNMTVSGTTIDTSKFFFPISHLFDFNINKNAALDVSNKVKLMNGSNLTINEGGTLNLTNSFIIYDGFEEITTGYVYPYNSFTTATKATLTNNGIINVTDSGGIGGYINTASDTGTLNYLTTNYEIKSPEYSGSFDADSENYHRQIAKGLLTSDETNFASNSISCNYYSSIKNPNAESYGWNYTENAAVLMGIKSTASDQTTTCGSNSIEAVVYNEVGSTVTYAWSLDVSSVAEEDKEKMALINNGQKAEIQNTSNNDYTVSVTVKMTDSFNNEREMTASFIVKAKLTSGEPVDITGISFAVQKKVDGESDYSEAESAHTASTNKYAFYSGETTTEKKTTGFEKNVYYKLKINLEPQGGYFKNLKFSWELPKRSAIIAKYRLSETEEFAPYTTATKFESEPNSDDLTDIEFMVGNNGVQTVTNCYLQAKLTITYENSAGENVTYLAENNKTYYEFSFYLVTKNS